MDKCTCGARPKVSRCHGWWHPHCPNCGKTTHEKMGCAEIYGYTTRLKAVEAWNRMSENK